MKYVVLQVHDTEEPPTFVKTYVAYEVLPNGCLTESPIAEGMEHGVHDAVQRISDARADAGVKP